MGTLPDIYQPAEWRNTTPADDISQRLGVGFDRQDGTVIRLSLSAQSAKHLSESLAEFLQEVGQRSHSSISSGMPSSDVSTPFDGVKV